MKTVVADGSALVEYLLRTEHGAAVEAILRDDRTDVAVPALCDVEVCSALRGAVLRRRLSPDRAAEALSDYRDLPLSHHGHLALLERIHSLRDSFSSYDGAYVALAERLGARLVTGDRALARAVRGHLDLEVSDVAARG